MTGIFSIFDTYSRKARTYPALVAGLPTLALIAVLVPWNHLGVPHAIAGGMCAVLLFAFADVARRLGQRLERKLGCNRIPELWFRGNQAIPEASKNRYRSFIAHKIGRQEPTHDEETTHPERAKDFYLAANAWLREHTRDTRKYNILFNENITYGFRRNLLGLKPVSIVINVIILGLIAVALTQALPYFQSILNLTEKLFVTAVAAVLHSIYMIFAVGKEPVWDASRAYGRQLILSCETFLTEACKTGTKPARKKNVDR